MASPLSFTAYDSSQTPQANAAAMISNQNQNYSDFLNNLPQYQSSLQNQAIDQGNQQYTNQKQAIDQNANSRGLLFSGLKQGAEQNAATSAANQTQSNIAQGNANLSNYAQNYGNQVAQSNIANYQGNVNSALNQYQTQLGSYNQGQQFSGQMFGGILGTAGLVAGGIGMGSDENLKDDVKDDDGEAQKMIDNLKAKSFSYKDDPEKKTQLGILAQDMEKSPMGKAVVIETPKGKGLDIGKTLSAMMAVQSVMNKRLKKAGA
jgi:uncharacterized coiled-coil protein SlyX